MTKSKINRLKFWLLSGHSVTPRIAVAKWDMWRLADSVYKLKRLKMNIVTEMVKKGKTVHAKYSLNSINNKPLKS